MVSPLWGSLFFFVLICAGFVLQGDDIPKRPKKPRLRECKLCKRKLPPDYKRLSCKTCVSQVMAEETPSLLTSMRDLIKEEIQNSLKNLRYPSDLPSTSSAVAHDTSSDEETGGPGVDEVCPDSDFSSSDESSGRPSFPPEEVDRLLKAVRATMALEEPKEEKSVEDKMFEELGSRKRRVFPVHKNIQGLIHREWKHPDKGIFASRALKRRYPFSDQDTSAWNRAPKLDVPISKVSKKSALPFEDSGTLPDPLDKKQEYFLKRTWEAAAAGFKPNIASSCVARSLTVWLDQLEEHIQNKTPRETILASLPTLKSAASFLTEASSDALKLSAKAAALSNSARRALWIKGWSGDVGSKNKLCSIPCEGEFLFGSVLDDLLEKAGDKGKGFPAPTPARRFRSFRGQRRSEGSFRQGDKRKRQDSHRSRDPKKSKGFLFNQRRTRPL